MKEKLLTDQTIINRPIIEVFNFFSKAENLNSLTPQDLSFKIVTPLPLKMHEGTLIDYKLKFKGMPFKWKTEIVLWQPPYKFIDMQIKGPYAVWEHQHIFEEKNGKTLMTDIVRYRSIGWLFAPLIHFLFVDKNVKQIFEYRKKRLNELFPDN